jgi:NAD(P)-dependent dehydrogenase (short-subunit alcohol dehydrogenase family)
MVAQRPSGSARPLAGKVAIITGAGRGIGRAMAIAFARAGASVVVNDTGGAIDGAGRDRRIAEGVVDEIRDVGGSAVADTSSVADRSEADAIVAAALDAFGRVDVLVNNAGIARQNMIWDMPEGDFDAMLATHLKGSWNCISAVADHFIAQRSGCVINVSSGVGIVGAVANTGYAAAKAGVLGLTFGAALDLGPLGVRVNAVFPAGHSRLDGKPEPWRDKYRTVPRPSLDPSKWPPENVPPLLVYLASDAARDVNGQLFACGGNSVSWYPAWLPSREITNSGDAFSFDELAARVPNELLFDVENPAPQVGDEPTWQWTRVSALPAAHRP